MKYLILGLGCLLASHSYANVSDEQVAQWKDRIVKNQDSQAAYEFAEYSYKRYWNNNSFFKRNYHSALYDMALQLGYPVPSNKAERMKLYERMVDVCDGYAVNHNKAGSILSDKDLSNGIYDTEADHFVIKLREGCEERNAKYEQEALKLGSIYTEVRLAMIEARKNRNSNTRATIEIYNKLLNNPKYTSYIDRGRMLVDLGDFYRYGNGVRANLPLSLEYYGKACDIGHSAGCTYYKKYGGGW